MVSALRYFKTIVDKMVVEKKVLEMLPGSASKVLEAILPLVQVEARIQHRWVIENVGQCYNILSAVFFPHFRFILVTLYHFSVYSYYSCLSKQLVK